MNAPCPRRMDVGHATPSPVECGPFTLQGVFPKKLPSSIHPSESIDVGAKQRRLVLTQPSKWVVLTEQGAP